MTHFLVLADKVVAEREDRLRAFNRVISHEIKNRIGAVLGASSVLREVPDLPADKHDELVDIIGRNAREMGDTVENVIVLSRVGIDDARQHRNVMLPEAIREAVRQIREAAQSAKVDVRIASDMPGYRSQRRRDRALHQELSLERAQVRRARAEAIASSRSARRRRRRSLESVS